MSSKRDLKRKLSDSNYWAAGEVAKCEKLTISEITDSKKKEDGMVLGALGALGGAGAILFASNPVGWTVGGSLAVGGIATIAYNKYKQNEAMKNVTLEVLNNNHQKCLKQTLGKLQLRREEMANTEENLKSKITIN